MDHEEWLSLIKDNINRSIDNLDPVEIRELAEQIQGARRVFLMGGGRTGLITQAFGMRLAQLGLPVFISGLPTTPALEKQDFLILLSGSGKTESLISAAQKADQIGSETYLVTQNGDSPLGKLVPRQLIIPSIVQETKVLNGTLLEMSLLLMLDAVVNQLVELTGQDYQDLTVRHANLD